MYCFTWWFCFGFTFVVSSCALCIIYLVVHTVCLSTSPHVSSAPTLSGDVLGGYAFPFLLNSSSCFHNNWMNLYSFLNSSLYFHNNLMDVVCGRSFLLNSSLYFHSNLINVLFSKLHCLKFHVTLLYIRCMSYQPILYRRRSPSIPVFVSWVTFCQELFLTLAALRLQRSQCMSEEDQSSYFVTLFPK